MLTDNQRRFLETQRVIRLATAGANGVPHVLPIVFALDGDNIYMTVDDKQGKNVGETPRRMKRLRNIVANPQVALVVDHYDEDWSQVGYVLVHGYAAILDDGDEHARAVRCLRERYAQFNGRPLEAWPVIAVRIEHAVDWGSSERSPVRAP
jgi:PPOX class probable F420-dependent enzyme